MNDNDSTLIPDNDTPPLADKSQRVPPAMSADYQRPCPT